ncbi:MAG: exo-alpha-sialidase [Clostridia bacterium]|nr:exo-alpha-sialidase [Clostridia bacterium]
MASIFQKVLAFSLVCVMLFGMIPAFPANAESSNTAEAAESTVIRASYAEAAIKLNGNPNETSWNLHTSIDTARIGAQWDYGTLYIGIKNPDIKEITVSVNGTVLSTSNAEIKNSANKKNTEYAVSFEKLGVEITDYNTELSAIIQVGSEMWEGTILLTSTYWVTLPKSSRGFDALAITDINRGATSAQGVKDDNGLFFYDRYNARGNNPRGIRTIAAYTDTKDFGAALTDMSRTTVIEFDFHADKMPVYELGVTDNTFYSYIPNAGFAAWITGKTESDNKPLMVSFGIINTEAGLVFVVHDDVKDYTYVLDKQVGDTFHIGLAWTPDGDLAFSLDGTTVAVYESVSFKPVWWELAEGTLTLNCIRALKAAESDADNIEFDITNLKVGKSNGDSVIDQITFEKIAGKNTSANAVTTDLSLSGITINDPYLDTVYPVVFESSDPSVIAADGKVMRPAENGKTVTLTAKIEALGVTKTIDVYVQGENPSASTLVTQNDVVTYKMKGIPYDAPTFTLDTTNNSVIRDLGEVKKVNVVVLKDSDDITRLHEGMLTIWVSDDNKAYQQTDSFKLLRDGQYTYLYDFEATGRYIKVHCTTHDTTDPDFTAPLDGMIEAYYDEVFGDGGNSFASTSTATVTNTTANTLYDTVYVLSAADVGVNCVTSDKSDVRFFLGEELLYHWYDGTDFYVRVTEVPANSMVPITILSGNANAKNISDKEHIYEVSYGTTETFNRMYGHWYMLLPNGTLFNFSGIAVNDKPFTYQVSHDEGRTWSGGIIADGSDDFLCIPYGDYYDEVAGRILVQGTRTMENGKLSTRVMYSDDLGKSWHKSEMILPEEAQYFQNYVDFTKCASYDGEDGPGVDFVFPAAIADDYYETTAGMDYPAAQVIVIYSKDGGKTWEVSESRIHYTSGMGLQVRESGVCEAGIICGDDGSLALYARCQFESVNHFAVSYSYDNGLTWTEEMVLSNVYATNTQALMYDFEGSKLLIWGGHNALGGASYRRYPIAVAVSYDNMKTFEGIQDMFLKTAYQGMLTGTRFDGTNPTASQVGDSLIMSFTGDGHYSYRIDNFREYLYRTKGAYDSFENATPEFEGWAFTGGMIENSTDHASVGEKSMKFSVGASAVRSIPSLSAGKISFDLWIDDPAKADVDVELESSFAVNYGVAAPVAFELNGQKLTFLGATSAVDVNLKSGWNTFVFDLNLDGAAQSATLSVNGSAAIQAPINGGDIHTYVSYVSVNCNGAQTYYLDNFLAEDNDTVLYTEKQVKTEISDFTELPETLSKKYESTDAVKDYMIGRLTALHGEAYTAENSRFMDLALRVSTDGGSSFRDAVLNDIPMEGIEIRLDYPEGTTAYTHEFKLIHMFTEDSNRHQTYIGKFASPTVTEREDGLYVKLRSIDSLLLLSWEQVAETPVEPDTEPDTEPVTDPAPTDNTAGGPSPILFVGIAAAVFVIGAVIGVIVVKSKKKSA